jgi:hypothetical protein
MALTKDDEMMLFALRKEREEVHERLMQIDRIIKKVRSGKYSDESTGSEGLSVDQPSDQTTAIPLNEFPKNADVKIQILRVMGELGKASKLKEIQAVYNRLSGSHFNIRETLRSMHRSRLIRLIREKDATRGMLWVKSEWVENDQLLEEYKPEGFDMLYKAENLEYE